MSEFILTVIGVAVIVGIAGMLTPDGDTKKYVRFVGALCLICALVAPVINALTREHGGLDDIFPSLDTDRTEYEEIYQNALAEGAKENAELLLTEKLLKDFGLPTGSLEVSLTLSYGNGSYAVNSAQVILNSSAVWADPREITEYVNEELRCPCTVIYG